METRRLELHEKLCDILGTRNVYFQPPEGFKMRYPAIVYELSGVPGLYANGGVYLTGRRYTVTAIDSDPDSSLVEKLAMLPTSRFDRHFKSDNLNHWVFTLHY